MKFRHRSRKVTVHGYVYTLRGRWRRIGPRRHGRAMHRAIRKHRIRVMVASSPSATAALASLWGASVMDVVVRDCRRRAPGFEGIGVSNLGLYLKPEEYFELPNGVRTVDGGVI